MHHSHACPMGRRVCLALLCSGIIDIEGEGNGEGGGVGGYKRGWGEHRPRGGMLGPHRCGQQSRYSKEASRGRPWKGQGRDIGEIEGTFRGGQRSEKCKRMGRDGAREEMRVLMHIATARQCDQSLAFNIGTPHSRTPLMYRNPSFIGNPTGSHWTKKRPREPCGWRGFAHATHCTLLHPLASPRHQ